VKPCGRKAPAARGREAFAPCNGEAAAAHLRRAGKLLAEDEQKARKAAVESVLQWKLAEGRVIVAELSFDEPSTKKFRGFLEEKEMTGKCCICTKAKERKTL